MQEDVGSGSSNEQEINGQSCWIMSSKKTFQEELRELYNWGKNLA